MQCGSESIFPTKGSWLQSLVLWQEYFIHSAGYIHSSPSGAGNAWSLFIHKVRMDEWVRELSGIHPSIHPRPVSFSILPKGFITTKNFSNCLILFFREFLESFSNSIFSFCVSQSSIKNKQTSSSTICLPLGRAHAGKVSLLGFFPFFNSFQKNESVSTYCSFFQYSNHPTFSQQVPIQVSFCELLTWPQHEKMFQAHSQGVLSPGCVLISLL